MITRPFTILLLQVALAFAAQQLFETSTIYAQDAARADMPALAYTASPADMVAPVEEAAQAVEEVADVAASAAKATEVVDNPYGLGALWAQGDFVAKGTLIILVIMSFFTWYIMFTKLWEQQRLMSHA